MLTFNTSIIPRKVHNFYGKVPNIFKGVRTSTLAVKFNDRSVDEINNFLYRTLGTDLMIDNQKDLIKFLMELNSNDKLKVIEAGIEEYELFVIGESNFNKATVGIIAKMFGKLDIPDALRKKIKHKFSRKLRKRISLFIKEVINEDVEVQGINELLDFVKKLPKGKKLKLGSRLLTTVRRNRADAGRAKKLSDKIIPFILFVLAVFAIDTLLWSPVLFGSSRISVTRPLI